MNFYTTLHKGKQMIKVLAAPEYVVEQMIEARGDRRTLFNGKMFTILPASWCCREKDQQWITDSKTMAN